MTLFRHFKSKEQLLRAVLQRGLASEVAIMDQHSSWKENLRESMEKYARHYYSHMEKKKGIARAFLAEAQILPKSMQTMIAEVIRPVRERLVLILTDAQRAGVVRNDLNVECALDAFKNALYAGMLRQGVYLPQELHHGRLHIDRGRHFCARNRNDRSLNLRNALWHNK